MWKDRCEIKKGTVNEQEQQCHSKFKFNSSRDFVLNGGHMYARRLTSKLFIFFCNM